MKKKDQLIDFRWKLAPLNSKSRPCLSGWGSSDTIWSEDMVFASGFLGKKKKNPFFLFPKAHNVKSVIFVLQNNFSDIILEFSTHEERNDPSSASRFFKIF